MPIHKQGSGYQWGNHGKIYRGKDARKKAEKQAAAAHANGFQGDYKGGEVKFTNTIKREIKDGRPQKQAVAIAYSEQKKAEKRKKFYRGGKIESKKPSFADVLAARKR